MKAITIYQPWASLIAVGAKKYETRDWATKYRGPIAIHAGAKNVLDTIVGLDNRTMLDIEDALPDNPELVGLPYGEIIATADLVECWHLEEHWSESEFAREFYLVNSQGVKKSWAQECVKEMSFGDFSKGRYAWELTDVRLLPEPVPRLFYHRERRQVNGKCHDKA